MNSSFYIKLQNRGLLQIEGPDRVLFLQNLVTNNVENIEASQAVYACLLTPQGKFLHDFFISEIDDALLLECEGGARAQDLYNRLNTYRLRADIQISIEDNVPVYAVFGAQNIPGYLDPRDPEMGWRSFDLPSEALAKEGKPFEVWDEHRIRLTIPDGSRDLIPEQSTMDEARMDQLNAIDYDKGCYIGQELTARMHYRGLGKKHLYTVEGTLPEPGEDITSDDGKTIGQMRSKCGDVGLALLKDEFSDRLSGNLNALRKKE